MESGTRAADPAAMLALQRQAGNAAVGRARRASARAGVQRAGPEPVEHLTADMFTVTGGDLQHTGNVTATPVPDSSDVMVEAPDVRLSATVDKHVDAPLGPMELAQVGPVQTLNGSRRVGVYRQGGDPSGDVVATHNATVGTARDAWWDHDADGGIVASLPEPWYSRPDTVSDASPTGNVSFHDTPKFPLPRTLGSGLLTEVRGEDRFTTSIAAKKDADVVHLHNQNWDVDWSMDVEAAGAGTGAEVASQDTTDEPSTTSGKIVAASVDSWLGFPTVEAAMTVDAELLLANLVPARDNDRASHANIVAALERKDPVLTAWLTVEETAEIFGSDEIEVTLEGHSRATEGPITLGDGRWDTFRFRLGDVVDLASVDEGFELTVRAQDTGTFSNEPATMTWRLPFADREDVAMSGGGGGSYRVSMTMGT